MAQITRLLCLTCLQSTEISSEHAVGFDQPPCPHCGGLLGNNPYDETAEHSPSDLALGDPGLQIGGAWSHAWNEGSLGQIGRFQLQEIIGEGGYGTVYKARDPRLGRDVALKTLKPGKTTNLIMGRFFREARTAAKLDHPRIVPVFDSGRDEEKGCWIAFQFVPGMTLSRHVIETELDDRAAVRIARDLADALHYCHRHKVMHRDLKPSNILIDDDGRAWLIDFGLARWMDHNSDFTQEKSIVGSYGYMPPEIMAGNSQKADARTDVYALGIILFELLCKELPAYHPAGVPLHEVDTSKPPRRVKDINAHVSTELDRICAKALAPRPGDRYQDMKAFYNDLDRWLNRQSTWVKFSPLAAVFLIGGCFGLSAVTGMNYLLTQDQAKVAQQQMLTNPGSAVFSDLGPVIIPVKDVKETGIKLGQANETKQGSPEPGTSLVQGGGSSLQVPMIVVNKTTNKYHRLDCKDVTGGLNFERVSATSPRAIGRKPCSHCGPDPLPKPVIENGSTPP